MDIHWSRALSCLLILGISFVSEASPWKDYSPKLTNKLAQKNKDSSHHKARLLVLDEASMRDHLKGVEQTQSHHARKSSNQLEITLPLSDGSMIMVNLKSSTTLPRQLSQQYPNIKTFRVIPNELLVNGRVDLTPNGFHAMVQTRSGEVFFIDPDKSQYDTQGESRYISYRKQDQLQDSKAVYSCGAKLSDFSDQPLSSSRRLLSKSLAKPSNSLLTYKIAIAATGEYVAKNGGTVASALAAITTTLNRVNQVFEQDLGIHLSLVENNDQLIYTDASSDPFYGSDAKELLLQNQLNTDAVIGSANYDIGHLFTTKGGGLASIGSACHSSRKAKGISGISNPQNDSFNLDFVAHEIGHQLGATHTFNSEEGLCSGATREASTAFEPGSGSTIMSYAGYCGADNLQSNTDAMFHIGSVEQISNYTFNGGGNRCGERRQGGNTAPKVNAGSSYIIPAQTPFELVGTATDDDNDALVYAWEQTDVGEKSLANEDKGNNALFRVHLPSNSQTRSFPAINDILRHTQTRGEKLPFQQRSLNFSFVAQDSYNTAQNDEMMVDIIRTGSRFALNMPRATYNRGETHQVFWNVANTDKPPINCSNVDISLSTDGGYVFDQALASNVPNTGAAWITIPPSSKLSTRGRFKLSCSDNVFFSISYRNFYVKDVGDNIGSAYTDEDQPEDDLVDKILDAEGGSVIKTPVQASGGKSSGGSFGYLLLIALLLPLRRRQKIT